MNLTDIFQIFDDPEEHRRATERKQRCLDQVRGILGRPQAGPNAPTDEELLTLISDLFHKVYEKTPFSSDYDPLIERLSFTKRNLGALDACELKRAWTIFLDQTGIEFGWPLNVGMAEWYVERRKVDHAITVFEHLYSNVRRGVLHHGEYEDQLESWLMDLLVLCQQRNLPRRASHVCEVMEDFYNDGYVSIKAYTESLSISPQLIHAGIRNQINSDRRTTQNRLENECGPLLDNLHPLTKKLLVEAELWSSDHWRNIEPWAAPLRWALAIESEFHERVFNPNRERIESALGDHAPRRDQVCGLGQIIEVIKKAASNNIGLRIILGKMRDSDIFASQETLRKLRVVRKHRNQVSHVRGDGVYSVGNCCDFLREIREEGWVFKFLEALQPRDPSGRTE